MPEWCQVVKGGAEHPGESWVARRAPNSHGGTKQIWVRLKIFLVRINLVSESFDSTQLMTHNGFTGIDSSQLITQNGFLKVDSNREYFDWNELTTQKNFSGFLLKSTHDSKIWNIDLNQVMTQWFESTVDFVDIFWAFNQFCWPFWTFTQFRWLFGAFTEVRWPFWAFN